MSAGDYPVNGWSNNNNVWYRTSTGINTTPTVTITTPYQTEIDWEAIRRQLDTQPGRIEANPPPPIQKKVVPRKPLRMIRLRENAKVS